MKKVLIMLMALPLLGLVSCWDAPTPRSFTRPVKLTKVVSLASYDKDFVGVVSAEQYTEVAFQVGGLITKTFINEGSFVKKGQILAQIDPSDIDLQKSSDYAQYQTTKSILQRTERLLAKQAISLQDVEIAKSNFLKAKSQYEYSCNQLSYTKLRAPFAGNIERKYVENYQKVNPGQAIYKIINPDVLEVNFTLPESDVDMASVRNSYFVEFDNFRGDLFEARIKDVVDASVDGAGIPVTLAIVDKRFKPEKYNIKAGFACRVRVVVDNPNVRTHHMTVPLSAIFQVEGSTSSYVWIYDEAKGTVIQREIKIGGLSASNSMIVLDGLTAGENVVSAGVYQITNNQKVIPLQ
ncbi:MAG: efflux RND transporter periplasmic adaptor subunit [Mucinivorans sp.]